MDACVPQLPRIYGWNFLEFVSHLSIYYAHTLRTGCYRFASLLLYSRTSAPSSIVPPTVTIYMFLYTTLP